MTSLNVEGSPAVFIEKMKVFSPAAHRTTSTPPKPRTLPSGFRRRPITGEVLVDIWERWFGPASGYVRRTSRPQVAKLAAELDTLR